VKVQVDLNLCQGYGTCAALAPEVFVLDEWGYATVTHDGVVAPENEDAARRALLECPMAAIVTVDG
jgi:ferredoxin